jgi:hypothetical protein
MENYATMAHEDLYKKIEKYDLDKEDYQVETVKGKKTLNVKKLSNVLKLIDTMAGKAAGPVAVTEDGDVVDVTPKTRKLHKALSGMMVEITFYNSTENDLPYVQLGLQGIALVVPRELKSWIPKEFLDGVIQNAIATRLKMVVSGTGKISYVPKQVPRLPHMVHQIKHIDVVRKEWDEEHGKK